MTCNGRFFLSPRLDKITGHQIIFSRIEHFTFLAA